LTCYNPLTKSYYAAGLISISAGTCGTGAGGQSVKLANYLQWIGDNSLAGDVSIDTTSVVTQATVATTATTKRPTVSSSPLTTTASTVNAASCGRPGNALIDPFNLTDQFSSSGTLKKLHRLSLLNGEKIVGGVQAKAREICWQVSFSQLRKINLHFLSGIVVAGALYSFRQICFTMKSFLFRL
jgi:hypothetical protein